MAYTSAKNSTGDLSVLLRNGVHGAATLRFALKCDSIAISYSKTPIQIPIPQQSPEIIDLGSFRPSISIGGIVDTTEPSPASITVGGQTYYIPFKNWLENIVYDWIASDSAAGQLELEIGDTTFPTDSNSNAYNSGGDLLLPASWTGERYIEWLCKRVDLASFQLRKIVMISRCNLSLRLDRIGLIRRT